MVRRQRRRRDQRGASSLEYILVVILVAVILTAYAGWSLTLVKDWTYLTPLADTTSGS